MSGGARETRILACAYACAPPGSGTFHGGEELLGWRLTQQLARFHEVDVLVSAEHETSLEGADRPQGVRFRYVDLPSWLHPLREMQGGVQLYAYLWQVKAWRVARRLHRRRSYDLFHHLTYANDWMASHVGALIDDLPFVRGPGGGAHRIPAQLLPHYGWRFRLEQRLRTLLQSVLRRDPFFVLGRRRASALLVCTREAMEELPDAARAKASLMPVVGVTDRAFDVTAGDTRSEGRFTVLAAGKLITLKGFDLAVRAFARFRARRSDVQLRIVGDGPERRPLERLARSRGVSDSVQFEGWRPRSEVLRRMAGADVFLFPSLRDGGGAVVVEAMATATPVVCLDAGGPGIHVTDDTGIKIEPASADEVVESMSLALERLYDHPDRRRTLGEAGRERAWARYRWTSHGDRIADIHRDALRAPS